MAMESRRGEVDSISDVLSQYKTVKKITAPGTIEGGDVIHFDDFLISGVTERTNEYGINQASEWLGIRIDIIEDLGIIHLKSHVTYLGDNTILVNSRFQRHPLLQKFSEIQVPDDEVYAANTLSINNVVLMSSRHPKTIQLVREAGFEVIPLNMSEFEKCEGALTCLSIVF